MMPTSPVAAAEKLVEPMLDDVFHRGRPAAIDLLLLVQKARRRQHDAIHVARRIVERILQRERRRTVVVSDERAVHVTGADAQLQHDRRVRRLRKLEAALDHGHDAFQVRARIEQPHLRLHRKGVRALLHDRGAFAVVLADDHQRAAGDAAGRDVRQRIRGDVGADGGFPGHCAADRIVDRSGEHRGGSGLRGAGFEVDAELLQQPLRIGQHVHEMRDRRALVAADVADAGLQQRLGDREDALAAELLSGAEAQLADFVREGPFSHLDALYPCGRLLPIQGWPAL